MKRLCMSCVVKDSVDAILELETVSAEVPGITA